MTEDFSKTFQLTDSLLRRLLNDDDYEHVKVIEPVIVMADEPTHSKLKNPVYKHAVISSKFLYIVNTPAKQDSDLLFTLDMEKVDGVQIVYDVADFLQGDLREQAQHIKISYKRGSTMVNEPLPSNSSFIRAVTNSTTKASDSFNSSKTSYSRSSSTPNIQSSKYKLSLPTEPKYLHTESLPTDQKHSITSLTENDHKQNKKITQSQRNMSKESVDLSKRPLPKPIVGTEKVNASYTDTSMSNDLRSMSPSKSCNNISSFASRFSENLLSSSTLSQSWNDIIKAGLDGSLPDVSSKESVNSERLSFHRDRAVTVGSSSDIGQSMSSRMFKFFKGKQDSSSSLSSENKLGSSIPPLEHCIADIHLDEPCSIDIFTVDKISKLYNVVKEAWIQSLLQGAYKVELRDERRSFSKVENNLVLQKFSKLKAEILNCKTNDQLFLLTKEIKYACSSFMSIKKKVWKSSAVIKFYLKSMKNLIESDTLHDSDRMDEIDMLILIAEFFICIFQGSEMFSNRNLLLNENGASLVKQMIQYLITHPKISNGSMHKRTKKVFKLELEELLDTWMDSCVGLLYEIIHAANQSNWCCLLQQKSFDVIKLGVMLSQNEKNIMKIIDHVMQKMTAQLSNDFGDMLSYAGIIQVYKEIAFLHFVSMNCSNIKKGIKVYHQEEIKYYIGSSLIKRIPTHYSLYPITAQLLSEFLTMVTR